MRNRSDASPSAVLVRLHTPTTLNDVSWRGGGPSSCRPVLSAPSRQQDMQDMQSVIDGSAPINVIPIFTCQSFLYLIVGLIKDFLCQLEPFSPICLAVNEDLSMKQCYLAGISMVRKRMNVLCLLMQNRSS